MLTLVLPLTTVLSGRLALLAKGRWGGALLRRPVALFLSVLVVPVPPQFPSFLPSLSSRLTALHATPRTMSHALHGTTGKEQRLARSLRLYGSSGGGSERGCAVG